MDFSRLRQGELVAGIGGIALFVFLFFDWFSGISGWDSLGGDVTGFIVALAAVVAIKFAALAAMGKRLNVPVPRGGITLALGNLAVLIILWTVISVPEGAEVDFGYFLGLAAAVAISVGALLALREDGWEPLVSVPGGRTRAASSASATASKPRATTTRKAAARKPAAKKPASSTTRKK